MEYENDETTRRELFDELTSLMEQTGEECGTDCPDTYRSLLGVRLGGTMGALRLGPDGVVWQRSVGDYEYDRHRVTGDPRAVEIARRLIPRSQPAGSTASPACRAGGDAARARRGRTLYGDYEHTWRSYPQGTPTFRNAAGRFPRRSLDRMARCEVCDLERLDFSDGSRVYR